MCHSSETSVQSSVSFLFCSVPTSNAMGGAAAPPPPNPPPAKTFYPLLLGFPSSPVFCFFDLFFLWAPIFDYFCVCFDPYLFFWSATLAVRPQIHWTRFSKPIHSIHTMIHGSTRLTWAFNILQRIWMFAFRKSKLQSWGATLIGLTYNCQACNDFTWMWRADSGNDCWAMHCLLQVASVCTPLKFELDGIHRI